MATALGREAEEIDGPILSLEALGVESKGARFYPQIDGLAICLTLAVPDFSTHRFDSGSPGLICSNDNLGRIKHGGPTLRCQAEVAAVD